MIFTVKLWVLPEAEGEQPRHTDWGSGVTAGQQFLVSLAEEGDRHGDTRAHEHTEHTQAVPPELDMETSTKPASTSSLRMNYCSLCSVITWEGVS